MRNTSQYNERHGFSLIEILVVIAIIAIVAGLILPAVMSAREAGRRTQCINNLRQLGLAMTNYATANGGALTTPTSHSYVTQLLPYMEQKNLYDSINFDLLNAGAIGEVWANTTVRTTKVYSLMCPAQSAHDSRAGWSSYPANMGYGWNQHGPFWNGLWGGANTIHYSDITDGTSSTAAMTEWVIDSFQSRDPLADVFEIGYTEPDVQTFATRCHSVDISTARPDNSRKRSDWLSASHNGYHHLLPPNDRSCRNGGGGGSGLYGDDAITAGSRHPGGANSLFVDGSVHFIKQTISRDTWQRLGTIRGGELTGEF